MSEKCKPKNDAAFYKKRRHVITMDIKVDIISRHENGERIAKIAHSYHMNESTIRTIIRAKDKIMQYVSNSLPGQSIKRISKRRSMLIEEMEMLLCTWIENSEKNGMPINFMAIREKALSIFDELKTKHDDVDATFLASHGWFHRFRTRSNLINLKIAANDAGEESDEDAENFPQPLVEIIESDECLPQEVFAENENNSWDSFEDSSKENKKCAEEKKLDEKHLEECLLLIHKGLEGLGLHDPDTERFSKVFTTVNNALTCYKTICNDKKNKS